jgi:hypothetical protein
MVPCTVPFEVTARAIARLLGLPDYPFPQSQAYCLTGRLRLAVHRRFKSEVR